MDYPLLLIADNDEDDVFFLRRAMTRLRILNPVREVRTGEDAEAYLEGSGQFANRIEHPTASILLLDVHLPAISGIEVLRWIRERKPEGLLAVLAWTGTSSPGEKLAMHEEGVTCVDKPTALAGYEELFNRFLGLRLDGSGEGRVLRAAGDPKIGSHEFRAF